MIDHKEIIDAAKALDGVAVRTPVLELTSDRWRGILPEDTRVAVKLELFQQAGSFKARGAYLGMQALAADELAAGVAAASGGNHALAVSWAAQAAGVAAQIMMPRATDPLRIEGCQAMGAAVTLHDDMPAAFAAMEVAVESGATLMHPFEAPHMVLGSATVGAEFLAQCADLDMLIVPIGGGGLIAGMARAAKLLRPQIEVIGVEPVGADSTTQSLAAGHPVALERISTIADSLGAPRAMPLTFSYAQMHIDRMVHVTDADMRSAMRHYFDVLRIIAEPACSASLAALIGPLRQEMAGRRVGIIACGSNISLDRFETLTTGA